MSDRPEAVAAVPECIACGRTMVEHYSSMFDDRYGFPRHFSLFRCSGCGQMQTVPLLRDEDLPLLYSTYYPRRQTNVREVQAQARDPRPFRERARRWWSGTDNQGQYAARAGSTVLDYGCGNGISLLELRQIGADAYGIETDRNVQQVAEALNLKIHIGSIDESPFPGVAFDLVVLNQVIEHIPQPHKLLESLAARLRRGGRIALAFPNNESLYARRCGREWINWHIPYHLHHFNHRSARLFFARHGWRVTAMRAITPNLWTLLQFRALVERTRLGVPNPMWTGQYPGESVPPTPDTSPPSGAALALQAFALGANRPLRRTLLTLFNRLIDSLGLGDSLLVTLEAKR